MIKLYVKNDRIEDSDNSVVDVSQQTVAAAKRGKVTPALRRAVSAALDEEILFA
jgi:hypothetical protein